MGALTDEELWAWAEQLIEDYGADTPVLVAAEMGRQAISGDADGLRNWKETAARVSDLLGLDRFSPVTRQ